MCRIIEMSANQTLLHNEGIIAGQECEVLNVINMTTMGEKSSYVKWFNANKKVGEERTATGAFKIILNYLNVDFINLMKDERKSSFIEARKALRRVNYEFNKLSPEHQTLISNGCLSREDLVFDGNTTIPFQKGSIVQFDGSVNNNAVDVRNIRVVVKKIPKFVDTLEDDESFDETTDEVTADNL